ncbi:FUSC family protein [Alcaligenaceae bacterium]|nr:FUSC family protein [Alcaligenaceae bacterium]
MPIPYRRRPRRRHASRSASARYLLDASQWQESLLVASPPSLRNSSIAGIQAALALFFAMATAYVSPWPELVGYPALGGLAALFGRFDSLQRRRRTVAICGFLLVAGVFLLSLASYLGAPPGLMVGILAISVGLYTIATIQWRLGGPGAVIFVFAAGAALGPAETLDLVLAKTIATIWGAALAWTVCVATDRWREKVHMPKPDPEGPPPFIRQAVAAGRITLGAGTAAYIAHAAGWEYPAWAAIGAASVMQGAHLHVTMNRAMQRMVGTVIGACIAWAILAQAPGFWLIVLCVVVFQFFTEVIIGYNYAFGQITVTPMALLMTHLAVPIAVTGTMPVERVFDTIVGAAIGIIFAVIFSSLDDRVYLARRRRSLRARGPGAF